jgi:hypothetical protein
MWAAEGKSPEAVDQNLRFEPENVFTELIEKLGWSILAILKRALQ